MAVVEGGSDEKIEARCVMVGLQMDANGKELLHWAINRVAERGDRIVAVTVCRDSDLKNTISTLSILTVLEDFLAPYEDACNFKMVSLVGRVVRGSSIRKALVNEAKICGATSIVVGANKHISIGGSALVAKYCAKKLPPTISLITVQDGRVIFEKKATFEKASPGEAPPPNLPSMLHRRLCMQHRMAIQNSEEEAGKESLKAAASNSGGGFENNGKNGKESLKAAANSGGGFENNGKNGKESLKAAASNSGGGFENNGKKAISNAKNHVTQTSVTVLVRQLPQPGIGWPLLRKAAKESNAVKKAEGARRLSVVQWAMALPDRNFSSAQPLFQLSKELRTTLDANNSSCKWFQYEELLSLTNQFAPENLIGKGGTGQVYKGNLQNGRQIAIKLSQLSTKSSRDFLQEVDIVTKLDHPHVVSLLGICVEKNNLISIYKYFVNGSLEEILHGKNAKEPLPWETRTKVAMEIAEALNYLHHGSQTVIHRDVKSSNILLDGEFEPQLSDFGLAIWVPKTSNYLTQNDIVGTFGYLAPEYFMYGRASNKIDVYAFGVVLLELLTGRMPINDNSPKGQKSLVMWATQVIENGNLMDLVDPKLDANYDKDQMRRMILAASLCITRIAQFRPAINKICSLLQGEDDIEKWICSQADSMSEDLVDCPDDEVYPASSNIGSLEHASIDVDHNASVTSCEKRGYWQEYLRGRWSRSSFN